MAATFINSKLTAIGLIASLLLGVMAIVLLPREEEPQIKVPMIDVLAAMPGASAKEVEQQVSIPMEKLLYELPGIEYIYSTSMPGRSMLVARFYVGEDPDKSIVQAQPETGHQLRSHPPWRLTAAGKTSHHRRCAGPGPDLSRPRL